MDNADRINFFIGAGGSAAFGIPSMKQLTEDFKNYINSNTKLSILYKEIHDLLVTANDKEGVDIESVMSIIVTLSEPDNIRSNLDDFTRYLLKVSNIDISQSVKDIKKKYKEKDFNELQKKYKKFIRTKLILNSKKIDNIVSIYDDFFGFMYGVYNDRDKYLDKIPYKSYFPGPSMHKKFRIFTTNYDTAIEFYFERHLEIMEFDTGSRKEIRAIKIINTREFLQRYLSVSDDSMKIIKLHGSTNWIKNKDGVIEDRDIHDNLDSVKSKSKKGYAKEEIMIYPLSQKQIYFSPYIQLFNILDLELKEKKIWLIIGYSFRDIFIRNMFENSIDSIKKIIMVHPHSGDVKKLFSKNMQKKIIEIRCKFGILDTEIKKQIDYQIKNI